MKLSPFCLVSLLLVVLDYFDPDSMGHSIHDSISKVFSEATDPNGPDCTKQRCLIDDDSLRFMMLGDWGGLPYQPYSTPIETNVAHAVAEISAERKPQFVLTLGDNFYWDGITDVNSERFQGADRMCWRHRCQHVRSAPLGKNIKTISNCYFLHVPIEGVYLLHNTFEKVYWQDSLQVPWYFLAGNHDHRGEVKEQLKYSQKSKRWNYPYYWYTIMYELESGATIDIVMIDTVILCGNTMHDQFSTLFKMEDQPRGPSDKQFSQEQLAYIRSQVENSKADYLFVAGHFPVYSIAEHGPTQCLLDVLEPILREHQASAYFCGHDHSLQHIEVGGTDEPTMHYVVSGAADLLNPSQYHAKDIPPGSLRFFFPQFTTRGSGTEFNADGGFVYVEITKDEATFDYRDANQNKLYHFSMRPRKL